MDSMEKMARESTFVVRGGGDHRRDGKEDDAQYFCI